VISATPQTIITLYNFFGLGFTPEEYRNGRSPLPFITFDNTGHNKKEDLYQGQMLVTDTQLFVRLKDGKLEQYDFLGIPDTTVTRDTVRGWIGVLKRWFLPQIFITMLFAFFIQYAVLILLGCVAGLLLNWMLHAFLTYPQLVRVLVMACTPLIVLDTLSLSVGYGMPFNRLFSFLIIFGYFIFGIRANRDLIT
jgi:hypothetical protein